MLRLGQRKTRIYGRLLHLTPHLGGWNPLWHLVFSLWDDAAGCGCWRDGKGGRWTGPRWPYRR